MSVSDATFESVHRRLMVVEAENARLERELTELRERLAKAQPIELVQPQEAA